MKTDPLILMLAVTTEYADVDLTSASSEDERAKLVLIDFVKQIVEDEVIDLTKSFRGTFTFTLMYLSLFLKIIH